MRAARAGLAIGVAIVAVLWAMAVVPAYSFFEWPRQIETLTLVGVVRIAAILGLVAGSTRFRHPLVRLVLAVAAVWLVWCPLTALPAILAAVIANVASGHGCPGVCVRCGSPLGLGLGGAPGLVDLVAIVVGLALAVWRRPRPAGGDPTSAGRTLLVRYGSLACLIGGPIAGLAGWMLLAPGDIYGGPLGLGVLIGLFGLVTFTGHAAFEGLLSRPNLASVMAAAYGAAVILVPPAYAAMAGSLRVLP